MTKKHEPFPIVFFKAIDLLKKNTSPDNREVSGLASDGIDPQELQANNDN
jgi:hypothetical protein